MRTVPPLVLVAASLACAEPSPTQPEPAETAPSKTETETEPSKTEPNVVTDLRGYPWARIAVVGNPVEPLEWPLDATKLAALGVRSHRAYSATTPRVWLFAFEFDDQAALLAAQREIEALVGEPNGAPYYRESSFTGAWLLVTGFPSEKPVSPQMHAARLAFISAWAGEE